MKNGITLAALATILLASGPVALGATDTTASPASKAQVIADMSEGEIRKVDKDTGKLTIRHGPLANLGMPAMTMVFRVKDPAMLNQVKVGEQVRFVAENSNGALTVVRIEAAK